MKRRKTNKQTSKQANKQTNKQTNKNIGGNITTSAEGEEMRWDAPVGKSTVDNFGGDPRPRFAGSARNARSGKSSGALSPFQVQQHQPN